MDPLILLRKSLFVSILSAAFVLLGNYTLGALEMGLEEEFSEVPLGIEQRADFHLLGLSVQGDGFSSDLGFLNWETHDKDFFHGDLLLSRFFFPGGGIFFYHGLKSSFRGEIPEVSGPSYFSLQHFNAFQGMVNIPWMGNWELGLGGILPTDIIISQLMGTVHLSDVSGLWFWGQFSVHDFVIGSGYGGLRSTIGGIFNSSGMSLDSTLLFTGFGPVKMFAALAQGKGQVSLDPLFTWILNLDNMTAELNLQAYTLGFLWESKAEFHGVNFGSRAIIGSLWIVNPLGEMELTRSTWDWETWQNVISISNELMTVDIWQPTYGYLELYLSQSWDKLEVTLGRRVFWMPGLEINKEMVGLPTEKTTTVEDPWARLIELSRSPWPSDWWWTGLYLNVKLTL